MKRYVRLSYDIGEGTPLYPETHPVVIEGIKEISKGDSCNAFLLTLSNHTGTHIDAPRHFWDTGLAISGYSLDELVFKKPLLIDCPKGIEEIIEINDLISLMDTYEPDLLLIRTGFHRYRTVQSPLLDSQSFDTYCHKNPYLSPQAAEWLRNKYPSIRAIGIDCISIASYTALSTN